MLPNGLHNCLPRLNVRPHVYDVNFPETVRHEEQLDKVYLDCGGSVLRTLRFTWRDYNGNVMPLSETGDWTAQLCFGFI